MEESVEHFWKKTLRFEGVFTPGPFWDILRNSFSTDPDLKAGV